MMGTAFLLQATNLSCVYQQKKLFSHLSFELEAGCALLIEGENGVGKSSLLRLLTGLATPSTGEINWQGQSIQTIKPLFWQHLHYVSHANGLKLGLSVLENLTLMRELALSTTFPLDEVLKQLKLHTEKNTPAMHLSAGQKRRLALAKLWLTQKTCWILDEPLTALDTYTQSLFLTHLKNHLHLGGIAIMTSHQAFSEDKIAFQTLRLTAC